MDIKTLLDKIFDDKNNSRSTGLLFETLVLELLKNYLSLQNKTLVCDYKQNDNKFKNLVLYDGYVPNGFDEYIGDTIFEIKAYKNKNSIFNLSQTLERIIFNIENSEIQNIIITISWKSKLIFGDQQNYKRF